MKISINEPCHENWEAMTPNQKGAFCGSCQKDVVDFSKMSIQGIKNFFSKPQGGKVCGRFEEKQLQELTFDDFFAKFTYWNFSKKFAVIFFMAFGFWIFSNSGAMAQSHHLKGEVAIEQPKQVKKPIDETKKIKGKIAIQKNVCELEKEEPKKIEKEKTKPVTVKEEHIRMGMVAYFPEDEKKIEVKPLNKIDKEPVIKTVEVINKKPEVKTVELIDEKQSINIIQTICTSDIKVVETTRKTVTEDPKASAENKILVYPNPTNGIFMVDTQDKQTLRVYDMTGRLVLTQAIAGLTKVDASQLENGAYSLLFTGVKGTSTKKLIITR